MKFCTFKPVRESKPYEKKMKMFENIESFERVYKF